VEFSDLVAAAGGTAAFLTVMAIAVAFAAAACLAGLAITARANG